MMTAVFSGITTSLTCTLWFETNTEEADVPLFSTHIQSGSDIPPFPTSLVRITSIVLPLPGYALI